MPTTPPSARTTRPVAESSATRPGTPVRRKSRLPAIALAIVAVFVMAMLALPRRSSTPDTDAAIDNLPVAPAPAPTAAHAVSAARAVKAPSKKSSKLENARVEASGKSAARFTAPVKAAAEATAEEDAATKRMVSELRAAADAPAALSAEILGRAAVTITGCLEMSVDENDFRLTDTEGASAPKARSWRTVFLKKRSAPVALIEPPDPRGMQKQIGKRVAATGLLTSRELKVNSLRVVGASCN